MSMTVTTTAMGGSKLAWRINRAPAVPKSNTPISKQPSRTAIPNPSQRLDLSIGSKRIKLTHPSKAIALPNKAWSGDQRRPASFASQRSHATLNRRAIRATTLNNQVGTGTKGKSHRAATQSVSASHQRNIGVIPTDLLLLEGCQRPSRL